jgi:hypothetical protein
MPAEQKKRIDPWAEVKQLESEEEQVRSKGSGSLGANEGVMRESMAVSEIASRSVWLLFARPLSTFVNVFGLIYAAVAILLFAQGKFVVLTASKNLEISNDGVILLASWIVIPPFWFAFDYWVMAKTAEARQLVAQSQVLQITVWAATLVVMAFMAKP